MANCSYCVVGSVNASVRCVVLAFVVLFSCHLALADDTTKAPVASADFDNADFNSVDFDNAEFDNADFDNDGVPDYLDLDQDNDGILNTDEGYVSNASLVDYPAQSYVLVPDVSGAPDNEAAINQTAGSVFRYPLLNDRGVPTLDFVGSIVSTDTRVDWTVQQQLPKLRHLSAGQSLVRWQFMRFGTDEQVTVDLDLTLSDLDGNRAESITVELQDVAGYSVSVDSNLLIDTTVAGKVVFTAGGETDNTQDDAVVLHLRNTSELTIIYNSSPNINILPGLDNNAAGFRHNFTVAMLDQYVASPVVRHTDNDGFPDHRDLDSNNDGRPDVDPGLDHNQDGMADGAVNAVGVPIPVDDGIADGTGNPQDETAHQGVVDEGGSQQGSSPGGVTEDEENAELVTVGDSGTIRPVNNAPAAETLNIISDVDNDSIADSVEGVGDADGDGVPNQYDLDSDNDGLTDLTEAGAADADNNGRVDDAAGAIVKTYTTVVPDFDGDGVPDFLDSDSDQDKVFDLVEAGGQDLDENGMVDDLIDQNGDGWDDRFLFAPLSDRDTDSDGSPDRLDKDNDVFTEPVVLEDFQQLEELDASGNIVTGGAAGCVLITGPQAVDPTLWFLLLLLHCYYLKRRVVPYCRRIIHVSPQ